LQTFCVQSQPLTPAIYCFCSGDGITISGLIYEKFGWNAVIIFCLLSFSSDSAFADRVVRKDNRYMFTLSGYGNRNLTASFREVK